MTKVCRKCNEQFDNDVDFCPYCGSPVEEVKGEPKKPVCPKCGTPLEGDEEFCPNCGAQIFDEKGKYVCPNCGEQLNGNEDFCPVCGMGISDLNNVSTNSCQNPIQTEPTNDSISNVSFTESAKQSTKSIDKTSSEFTSNPSFWNRKGRLSRQSYIIFSVIWAIVWLFYIFLHAQWREMGHVSFAPPPWNMIFYVARVLVSYFDVRRLHDCNRSGFWAFIGFVPIINIVFTILMCVISGTHGDNKYGPEPK